MKLTALNANYSGLLKAINALETKGLTLSRSLAILQDVTIILSNNDGVISRVIYEEFQELRSKNDGLETLEKSLEAQ